jgi:hypothetical protein
MRDWMERRWSTAERNEAARGSLGASASEGRWRHPGAPRQGQEMGIYSFRLFSPPPLPGTEITPWACVSAGWESKVAVQNGIRRIKVGFDAFRGLSATPMPQKWASPRGRSAKSFSSEVTVFEPFENQRKRFQSRPVRWGDKVNYILVVLGTRYPGIDNAQRRPWEPAPRRALKRVPAVGHLAVVVPHAASARCRQLRKTEPY